MANSPEMRASDADRDRVAAILREHTAQGRITMDEFNERLESLYKAKTYGELAKLTSDLPDVDLRRLPAKATAAAPERRGMHPGRRTGRLHHADGRRAGRALRRRHRPRT
ncbi:DUF1707 domain-containing protein, partial [Nonomuraea fuscirosea]|uniref:DUF1707 SHOCT-like domain-containing protein n=1 Tax=Nonomuraea fuscirosea TaxID=1291556 RepID=UPI003412044F